MRLVCPNSHEHKRFSVIVHVTQEWEVSEDGMYESTIDNHIETLEQPNAQNHIFCCTECGEEAITKGEIVLLYATITNNTMPYIDIFNKEEDAKAEIGKMSDDGEIIGYIKGCSFKPLGGKYLYDDAPDFCYSVEEAVYKAERLGIELTYYRPVI